MTANSVPLDPTMLALRRSLLFIPGDDERKINKAAGGTLAVVQLRNEAGARQVVGAETALVHGLGGVHMSGATAILSRRSTLT
jgi:hypothetical protein